MTPSDDRCHFFRLPLELRDAIYGIVISEEKRIGLHINLSDGERQEPQLHVYTLSSIGRTSSELKREYSAALQRLLKNFLAGGTLRESPWGGFMMKKMTETETRLHVSQTRRTKKGHLLQNTHAVTTPVLFQVRNEPLEFQQFSWISLRHSPAFVGLDDDVWGPLKLVVLFAAAGGDELEDRVSLVGPHLDSVQDKCHKCYTGPVSCEADFAMKDMVEAERATDWSGHPDLYRLWEDFVLCCVGEKYWS